MPLLKEIGSLTPTNFGHEFHEKTENFPIRLHRCVKYPAILKIFQNETADRDAERLSMFGKAAMLDFDGVGDN